MKKKDNYCSKEIVQMQYRNNSNNKSTGGGWSADRSNVRSDCGSGVFVEEMVVAKCL